MSWFSHLGTKEMRFEVSLVLQTVRYKNLGNSPLYVVWARNDKLLKTKPVRGEKYVYDFTDATGNPPEPAVPLTLPCTMYLKSGKFLPKKSKLYLKYKKASGGSEMDLGVTELNISEHLNPKTPSVPVKETITLQFGKSLDRGSTVTFQLQARWLEGVDVKKLREEDPDAVSRASGVSSAYHAQNADGTSQSRDNPEHVDEPATDDDDEPAASPPVAQPKPRKVLSAPPAEDDQPLEDEDGAVAGVGEMEEYDEDENSQERAARKAAKAAKKAAKAEKKAKKAAKRAAAQDEDGSEEVEDEEDPSASPGMSASASASPAALAYAQSAGLAVASPAAALASPPAKSTSGAPASGAGSARGSLSGPALAATSPAAATIPAASSSSPAGTASASATAAAPPAVDESVEDDEPEADDPSWTNFTGTIPYILSQQQSDAPDLAIPQPLAKLMKAVKKLGGYETEGIFKRQPDAAMVQALRERMESGVYKLKTDDPHIPAFTIKTWLSSLAIPIFPPSVHAVMLRAGSMDDVDEAELERRRREDKERERREQEEEDEEEDAAANAGPNADPRYRKSNKQKELAADLYSDILHPEASSPSHHNAPAGGEQEKKETVKDLVVQVVSSIPASHRAVLSTLLTMFLDLLKPKSRKKNGHDLTSIATIFGDLLTRLAPNPAMKAYEHFIQRTYINKFLEYTIKYSELVIGVVYADVPYPRVRPRAKAFVPAPREPFRSSIPGVGMRGALGVDEDDQPEVEKPDYSDLLPPPAGPPPSASLHPMSLGLHAPANSPRTPNPNSNLTTPMIPPDLEDEDQGGGEEMASALAAAPAAVGQQPAAAASAEDAPAAEGEEEDPDGDPEELEAERLRRERKKAKKEAKAAKKAAKHSRKLSSTYESGSEAGEDEYTTAGETPMSTSITSTRNSVKGSSSSPMVNPLASPVDALLSGRAAGGQDQQQVNPLVGQPLGGLTPQKPSAGAQEDLFADLELPKTPQHDATAAASSASAAPLASFAPSALDEEPELTEEEQEAQRLQRIAEVKEQKRLRKLKQQEEDAARDAQIAESTPYDDLFPPAQQQPAPPASIVISPPAASSGVGMSPLTAAASAKAASAALDFPGAGTGASAAGGANSTSNKAEQAHLEQRIKDLEAQLQERDATLQSVKAELATQKDQHAAALHASEQNHAKALQLREDETSELERQVAQWKAEAAAAKKAARDADSAAAMSLSSSPSGLSAAGTPQSSKSADEKIAKLQKKLQAARDEADELVEENDLLKKREEVLQAISKEKSNAMSVLERMVQAAHQQAGGAASAGATTSPNLTVNTGATPMSRTASSSSSLTSKPLSSFTSSEVSDLVEEIRERILRDDSGDGTSEAATSSQSMTELSHAAKRSARGQSGRKLSTSIDSVTSALEKKDADLRRSQQELHEAQEALEKAQREQEEAETRHAEEIRAATTRLEQSTARVKQLESEQGELHALKASVKTWQVRAESAEGKVEESSRRALAAEESRAALKADAEKANRRAEKLEAKLEKDLPEVQKQLEAAQREREAAKSECQRLQQENEQLTEQLEEKKSKIRELINANEKRVAAETAAAAVSASPARRRGAAGDSDSSDDDASTAAARRRRAAASSSTSSSAASPSSELLSLKQLLADKNSLLEDLEANEAALKGKLAQVEQSNASLTERLATLEQDRAAAVQKANKEAEEAKSMMKALQRELDDLQKQTQALILTPRKSPVASGSPNGKGASSSAPSDSEDVELLHTHIASLDLTIQGYLTQIQTLEAQLEKARGSASTTNGDAEDGEHEAELEELRSENAKLKEKVEKLKKKASGSSSSSGSGGDASEVARLTSELSSLRSNFDAALELHKLKMREVQEDAAAKISILQKFKQQLGEKHQALEAEVAELRKRELTFNSLNSALATKYTDPSARKKLADNKQELSLLLALQEQQRRTAFLETQLRHADETLLLTKQTYQETTLILEQELDGLENENTMIRELYTEVKGQLQAVLQQQGELDGAPPSSALSPTSGGSYTSAAMRVDWSRYESAKLRLAQLEKANAEAAATIAQMREKLQAKTNEAAAARKQEEKLELELKAVKADLVKTGITLKTIASDNFEMKEWIRENAKK